jgi:hypothetical protein
MISKEEYHRRKAAQESRYRHKFAERRFGWWRNPPDRFAFLLVAFTAGLFAATVALWYATRDLVLSAEKTAERQLRAYVAITEITVENIDSREAPIVDIHWKNVGQTPAYDFTIWANLSLREAERTDFPTDSLPPISKISLGAGMGGLTQIRSSKGPLSPATLAALRDGIAIFYVFGTLAYTDIFGVSRFTNFRSFLNREMGIRDGPLYGTKEGNDAN